MKQNITIIEINDGQKERIRPLWEKQCALHAQKSTYFGDLFGSMYFDKRWQTIVDSAIYLHVNIAVDNGINIGYCISAIYDGNKGEVESIYIEPSHRRCRIGHLLMEKALSWMNTHNVSKKCLKVATGNEEVIPFYAQFGFYPRMIELEYRAPEED